MKKKNPFAIIKIALFIATTFAWFFITPLHSTHAVDWLEEGKRHLLEGRYLEAAEVLSKGLETLPRSAQLLYMRGTAYGFAGRSDAAIADFSRAIELKPTDPELYFSRGIVYQQKNKQMMMGSFKQRKKMANRSESDQKEIKGQEEREASIKQSETRLKELKKIIERYQSAGYKTLRFKAQLDFTKAIELNPQKAVYYYYRAGNFDKTTNFDAAVQDYTEAIRLNPNYKEAYIDRGAAYYNFKKDTGKALNDFNRALSIDPEHPIAYANRARVFRHLGDLHRALADAKKAAILDPTDRRTPYYIKALQKEIDEKEKHRQ